MWKKLCPYDGPVLIFFFSAVLSAWVGYDLKLALPALYTLAAGCALYLLLSRLAGSARAWQITAVVFTALATAISLYFITQAGRLGYEDKIEPIARVAGWISTHTPDFHSWQPMPNSLAVFLEGFLFLACGLFFTSAQRKGRWGYLLAALVIAFAMVLSSSRGAWLGVAGAALIWASLRWKPARFLVILTAMGLGILALYTIASGDINSINRIPIANRVLGPLFIRPDRLEVYRNSLALIADTPYTGIGLGGQFAMVYSRYALMIQVPFLTYSHNLFLEVWLEQGLLGILSWAAIMACLYANAWRSPAKDLRFESTWVGLTAIYLHGLTDARPYQDLWCWVPFFALLGLNAARWRLISPASPQGRRWLLPASAAALLILAVLVRFWPLDASLLANSASLLQQRADLNTDLSGNEREKLREQSVLQFQQALIREPNNRTANQRMGLVYFDALDYSQAIPLLKTALASSPTLPATRRTLGLAYAFSGDFENAAPLLGETPGAADELNTWAFYFLSRQQAQEALNAYQTSLHIAPNQPAVREAVQKLQNGQSP